MVISSFLLDAGCLEAKSFRIGPGFSILPSFPGLQISLKLYPYKFSLCLSILGGQFFLVSPYNVTKGLWSVSTAKCGNPKRYNLFLVIPYRTPKLSASI